MKKGGEREPEEDHLGLLEVKSGSGILQGQFSMTGNLPIAIISAVTSVGTSPLNASSSLELDS